MPEIHDHLTRIVDRTEKVIAEQLGQTKADTQERIDTVRRTLYDRIPGQIQANMQLAFEKASEESGQGMKARMVDIIAGHANEVSDVMFQDAQRDIIEGVRGLADWLADQYAKMLDTVRRHTNLAVENLNFVAEETSGDQIEKQLAAIDAVAQEVERLMAAGES